MTHLLFLEPLLLEAGDRMSREEFLERWERMPSLKIAELINGVVYVPSPVSWEHSNRDAILHGWAFVYASRSGIAQALANGTWLMEESAPQPDLALRLLPQFGGRSREEGGYPAGAPEFVAEVTRSSRSYDLGPKLELYERAGVKEYLAVLLEEQRLEWRVLRAGRYSLLAPDAAGIWRSTVFAGLWLDERAFWNNDTERLLARLEEGLRACPPQNT